MRPPRIVTIALACGAVLALAACGGGSNSTPTPAGSNASGATSGPKADALLVIADPERTKDVLNEALTEAAVKKYFLTSLSMNPDSFNGLTFADETIWGTVLTPPSADAGAFNTAYQDAYGHPASDVPGTAAAYDSVYVVALAALAANSDNPAVIRDNITYVANSPGDIVKYGTDAFSEAAAGVSQGQDVNYIGASGQVDIDANGELAKTSVQTWRVLNGTIAPIETRDIDIAAELGAEVPQGSPPVTATAPDTALTIGMIVPDTPTGASLSQAAHLAVDEVNAAGGVWGHDVVFELTTIAATSEAADAATRLINDAHAQVILGPTSVDDVSAVFDVTSAANVPLLSLSGDPALTALTDTNKVLFRMVPSEALQMPVLANLVLEGQASPILTETPTGSPEVSATPTGSVCVLYQAGTGQEQLAKAFASAMQHKNATVRASVAFDPDSADYKSLLQGCIGS
jgi:ABC-type branched-subunit amino acid transport system substrate-binding protein